MPSLVSYATLLMLALVVTSGWAQAASFTFTLQPGWNLISFPVLPEDRSPAAVFGAMKAVVGRRPLYPSNLRMVLATGADRPSRFPIEGNCWSFPVQNRNCDRVPPDQSPPLPTICPSEPLQQIEFGKAYWAYLVDIGQNSQFTLEGQPAPAIALTLEPGWHALGLVGADETIKEAKTFLGESSSDTTPNIGAMATWDANKQCFDYSSKHKEIEKQKGYLVKILNRLNIEPRLLITLVDTKDQGEAPKHFRIPSNKNQLILDFTNPGKGVLQWQAKLLPTPSNIDQKFKSLNKEELEKVISLSLVRNSASPSNTTATTAQGTATIEGQWLKINLKSAQLPPGRYLAQLAINTNINDNDERLYNLEFDATGLDGEWRGQAKIETVNNKPAIISDIDLWLQLFRVEIDGYTIYQ